MNFDTPHAHATSGFSHVPFLRASYTSNQADADGRCHNANYWAETQILSSDVDTANSIAMVRPAALGTSKHSAFVLAAHVVTARAGTAREVLVLQGHLHPQALGLVGELATN